MTPLILLAALGFQEEAWTPKVQRTHSESSSMLELSGTEALADDVVLSISARLVLKFRRTPDDVPETLAALLDAFDRGTVTRTERTLVQNGEWKHELPFTPGTLVPGVYELALEFDPTAQRPVTAARLPPDIKPISRKTRMILAAGKDEYYWADEVERLHRALTKVGTEFMKVEEAAKKDGIKKSLINRVVEALAEQVTLLEPHAGQSMVTRTTWQLFDVPLQIVRSNEGTSDLARADEEQTAQLGQMAIDEYHNARRMFSGEVYLYMRTLLAEMRDQTWAAYSSALKKEKLAPWKAWKPHYAACRKGLARAHVRMLEYEEAELYKERAADESNQKTSISWALEALDRLTEACERRLNDPKADPPDALLQELNENLPPPPEEPKQP